MAGSPVSSDSLVLLLGWRQYVLFQFLNTGSHSLFLLLCKGQMFLRHLVGELDADGFQKMYLSSHVEI